MKFMLLEDLYQNLFLSLVNMPKEVRNLYIFHALLFSGRVSPHLQCLLNLMSRGFIFENILLIEITCINRCLNAATVVAVEPVKALHLSE